LALIAAPHLASSLKDSAMTSSTIPAQPGFFVVYPDGDADPVIAWEINSDPGPLSDEVWPITPKGWAGDAHQVEFRG